WRQRRALEISAPDGWLTLVGLQWLEPGVNAVGSAQDNRLRLPPPAPEHLGVFTVSGKIVQLLAPAGGFPPELTQDGAKPREGALTVDNLKPSLLAWHGLTLIVLERGGRYVLRVKDADSPARASFHGLRWYDSDATMVIAARWIPFTPAHQLKIPTVIGTTLEMPAPGVAEFTLAGKTLRLEPVLEDPTGKTLFFILRDQTSKTTTYGAGRFLHTQIPDHGLDQPGELLLDFNRLENPPCAYTPWATCPLPPEQNRLPVAIEAGEMRYEP
ncbi:MAG: DUF1684 domain-containing protein, partial [Terracidiphilus sp.]